MCYGASVWRVICLAMQICLSGQTDTMAIALQGADSAATFALGHATQ